MALEKIIEQAKSEQVLVDVPVEVMEKEVELKTERKIPWRLIGIGSGLGLLLLVVVGGVMYLRGRTAGPDLEMRAPDGAVVVTPIETPTPDLQPVLSNMPYENIIEKFRIYPPSGWVVDDSRKSGNFVVFLSPISKEIDGRSFATLINVETKDTNSIQLADQVNEIKQSLADAFPDFEYENDLQLFLSGRPYFLIGGTYYVDTVKMRRKSLITIYNNRGYAISATGPLVSWQEYEEVITKSMYSFELL